MPVSADNLPTPRAQKDGGNHGSDLLPFHARPHSKWDPSLIVDVAPSIVTTGPPITRSTLFGSQNPSLVGRSVASPGTGLSPTTRGGQGSATRTGTTASALGAPSFGLFADGPRNGRDNSYLSRLAPTSGSPVAQGRSKLDSQPTRPQIPYAVRDSDAVREMEVLLLESIRWSLLGGKTSFIEFADGQPEPARVLDVSLRPAFLSIELAKPDPA